MLTWKRVNDCCIVYTSTHTHTYSYSWSIEATEEKNLTQPLQHDPYSRVLYLRMNRWNVPQCDAWVRSKGMQNEIEVRYVYTNWATLNVCSSVTSANKRLNFKPRFTLVCGVCTPSDVCTQQLPDCITKKFKANTFLLFHRTCTRVLKFKSMASIKSTQFTVSVFSFRLIRIGWHVRTVLCVRVVNELKWFYDPWIETKAFYVRERPMNSIWPAKRSGLCTSHMHHLECSQTYA